LVFGEFACSNHFDNSVLAIGAVRRNARDLTDRLNHKTEWMPCASKRRANWP